MRPRTDSFRNSLLSKADQRILNKPDVRAFPSYSVLKTIKLRK